MGQQPGASFSIWITDLSIRADGGVEVGTEKVWSYVRDRKLPSIICINKMDKEHAAFDKCIEHINELAGRSAVVVQLPIGEGVTRDDGGLANGHA